jgi:glycosyltransferase involved in cell wall biosynthesis
MKLSVLIPTLPDEFSRRMLTRLNNIIDPQISKYPGEVEKIIHDAGRSMSTGTKRNQLIHQAEGDYIMFLDCDDVVSWRYLDRIMEGIGKGVDVVTFNGVMTTRDRPGSHVKSSVDFIIKLGEKYEERGGKYYRFPNHITCMRKDLIEKVKFPDVWKGEDYTWAKQIHDRKLLKTEHHIEDKIYTYDFIVHK